MASLSAAMNFEHGDGDEDYLQHGNESCVTNHRHLQELQRLSAFQQVTTKVPPSYDGRSSWFAYEDAIDDWCDITELDGDKRGPALRNRLEGEAAIHKRLLDRDRLKDPNNGVKYLKSFLRPLFVKGAANVFLYRFQQFMNLHRGNGDMLRWITRFQLSVQRMQEAWNDTYLPITDPMNAEVRAFIAGLPAEEQATITNDDAMERANERLRDQHARTIPITANLVALIFVSLSDLTQDQRQVLTSLMAHRNRVLADYRMNELREVYLEIFCTTKTSVDNLSSLPQVTVAGKPSWLLKRATWTIKRAIGSRMKRMAQRVSLKQMKTPSGSMTRTTTRGFRDVFKEGKLHPSWELSKKGLFCDILAIAKCILSFYPSRGVSTARSVAPPGHKRLMEQIANCKA